LGRSQLSQDNVGLVSLGRVLGERICGMLLSETAAWDPAGVAGLGLWDVLSDDLLSEDERRLADSLLDKSGRWRVDRLVERRIERALSTAIEIQMAAGECEAVESVQAVLLRSSGDSAGDVAAMDPGGPIEALIDQVVSGAQAKTPKTRTIEEADLRIEVDGLEVNLLDDDQVKQVRAGITSMAQHMERVLDLDSDSAGEDDLEERDLSGMLLGGKYRVKRLKGKGGFGNVYEAVDEMLGARVALKVLNRRAERSPGALENFLREAKLLTSIDHENIVRWITFDRTDDGLHYFVMEYLGGEELEELLLRDGHVEPMRCAQIVLRVLDALRAAHRLDGGSLLHLDLKPENVFVLPAIEGGDAERVKVIDFGISQHVGAEARQVSEPASGQMSSAMDEDPSQTISATVSRDVAEHDRDSGVTRVRGGTLLYASPEQIEHLAGFQDIERLDGRSDLYSLGIMAYRMLTGVFPFDVCYTAADAIKNHLEVEPTPLSATGNRIPRKLAQFVDRCLAKRREDRWHDSTEAYEALKDFVHPKSMVGRMVAGVVTLLLVAGGLFAMFRDPAVVQVALQDSVTGGPAQTLSLGVGSRARELAWENWPVDIDARELALVDPDGAEIQGWTLEWGDQPGHGIRVAIDADAPPGSVAGVQPDILQASVAVSTDAGVLRVRSLQFRLKFLGAWSIDGSPEVVDHDGPRSLDPRSRELEVALKGAGSGLAAVEWLDLSRDGESLGRAEDPNRTVDGLPYYRLPLDALDGVTGEVELTIQARDRSGRTDSLGHRLLLAGPPARLDRRRTGICRGASDEARLSPTKGRHSVDPGCTLVLASTGRTSVSVRVEQDGVDQPIASDGPHELDIGKDVILPLADLGLDLSRGQCSGRLVLSTSDEAFIDRMDYAVQGIEFDFDFYPEVPELTVRLAVAGSGGVATPLRPDDRAFFGWSGAGELTVERSDQARSLVVEVATEQRKDGAWVALPLPAQEGHIDEGSQGRSTSFEFMPPSTGIFRFRVRAFDDVEGERGSEVGEVRDYEVLLDTQKPLLSPVLTGFDAGGPITKSSAPGIELLVEDGYSVASASWRLTGPAGQGARGEFETAERETGRWGVTGWPELWSGPLAARDGDYSLELMSTDRSGNQGRATVDWRLSRVPPEVQLVSPVLTNAPDGTRQWPGTKLWNVSAVVKDPNPIDRVQARIINLKTQAVHDLELERIEGRDTYEITPSKRPAINPRWSENMVRIEILARDSGGNELPVSEEARLPLIEKVYRPRIASMADPADVMIFVPGNERFKYIAGGRKDEGQRTTRWEVAIGRGELEPFYLDRNEVSCAAYRRFAADPDGYSASRWWPAGTSPSVARKEAWLQNLEETQAQEIAPVTGVTWAEALAFARYHDKRLPTMVEWEYAVRGGEAYRDRSSDTDSAQDKATDVVGTGVGAGLEGLVTGVREWTSTPGSFYASARRPKEHFAAHTGWLLRTPETVVSADLDGDGQLDHVAVVVGNDRVEVWFAATEDTIQLGDAARTPRPLRAICTDVNGDGQQDIVAVLADGRTVEFLNSGGEFTLASIRKGTAVSSMDAASFSHRWVVGASSSASEFSFLSRSQQDPARVMNDVGFRCAMDAERALDLEESSLWGEKR